MERYGQKPKHDWVRGPARRAAPLGFSVWLLVLALGATGVVGVTGCKKKKSIKLTPAECDRFCRRLVPCFDKRMATPSKDPSKDIQECVQNCRGKEGQRLSPVLRAMKRCADIKDCTKLIECFEGKM